MSERQLSMIEQDLGNRVVRIIEFQPPAFAYGVLRGFYRGFEPTFDDAAKWASHWCVNWTEVHDEIVVHIKDVPAATRGLFPLEGAEPTDWDKPGVLELIGGEHQLDFCGDATFHAVSDGNFRGDVLQAESSFRRGFSQAVAFAAEAVEKGASAGDIYAWNRRLHSLEWRNAEHFGMQFDREGTCPLDLTPFLA